MRNERKRKNKRMKMDEREREQEGVEEDVEAVREEELE